MSSLTDIKLLKLSIDSYSQNTNQAFLAQNGYKEVYVDLNKTIINPQTGKAERLFDPFFKAKAYYNDITHETVIAYTGTNDVVDLTRDDPAYSLGYQVPQFRSAVNFYDEAVKNVKDNEGYVLNPSNIILTGHSHGGGLASMVGIYKKDVDVITFNAPDIQRQLDNIETFKDLNNQVSFQPGELTSRDPSSFNIKSIVLESDFVHNAGGSLGEIEKISDTNSMLGTSFYTIAGYVGSALTANPLGGVATGLFSKYFAAGITANHLSGALLEAMENQHKLSTNQKTTTQEFKDSLGGIDKYLNKGISSGVEVVNKSIDFMGNIIGNLSDEAGNSLKTTVDTFKNLFPKNDTSAPVSSKGVVNFNLIDNYAITNKSLLQNSLSSIFKTTLEANFNFNTFSSSNNYLDSSRSFSFNSQNFILTNPMDKISFGNSNSSFGGFGGFNFNSDAGKINSLNSSSTAYKAWDEFKFDDYKLDLKTSLKLDFSINKNIYNSLNNFGNATNHASPLAFDLDGDGIETTHAYETNIYFDIDNDNFAERVGWIAKDDGQLVIDKNLNGQIDNVTELFGDYRMSAWDELRLLDSNKDNLINSEDSQFS